MFLLTYVKEKFIRGNEVKVYRGSNLGNYKLKGGSI
ncbi:hypothetical protein Cp4440_01721 [Clostridium perfringens]|nr:hypothetical protein [Clostridium perfringens]